MIDWKSLADLRAHFLSDQGKHGDYWSSAELIADYDETFAERIGWKWDSVLDEISTPLCSLRAWRPAIVDWGAGSGMAARRFVDFFGADHIASVTLIERSSLARKFATQKLKAIDDKISITNQPDANHPFVLLVSHVLGELGADLPADLQTLVNQATAVIWIEPGTPSMSRRLIQLREQARDRFHLLAPCPHQSVCGLLKPGNETHWCHHFAKVPAIAFQHPMWNRFGSELGIDLRSLPISYLVMIKKERNENTDRVIGRPRAYKGYLKVLVCDEGGVTERRLLEKSDKAKFKKLKKGGFALRFS